MNSNAQSNSMTYSSAVNSQPATYGANVNDLLQKLNNNMKTLENVGNQQQKQDQAMEAYTQRFQNVEEGLRGHGAILTSLAQTQERQGQLMSSLNTKMDNLTEIVTGTKTQDTLTQDLSLMTQSTQASNPSQGAPEGEGK